MLMRKVITVVFQINQQPAPRILKENIHDRMIHHSRLEYVLDYHIPGIGIGKFGFRCAILSCGSRHLSS